MLNYVQFPALCTTGHLDRVRFLTLNGCDVNGLTQTARLAGQKSLVLTCGLGDAPDQDGRDGHDDTADGRDVGDQLSPGGALARQHALEVDLKCCVRIGWGLEPLSVGFNV